MTLRRPPVRNLGLMVLFVALVALAVGGVSALASSDAPAGWEVGAASEKMDLSVSDSALAVGKTLSDFPVKVLLSQGNFDYTGGAEAEHLVFTTVGNSTPLPYEVEEWEPAGTSVVWVRVPQVTSTPQELDLYFGSGTPANVTDPTEVWEAGYVAVNHFDGTSGTAEPDSTSNGFDGTIGAGIHTLAEPGQDGGLSVALSGTPESDVDFGTTMGDALEHFTFSTTVDVSAEDLTGTSFHLIGGRDQNSGPHPGEQFSLLIHEGHAYASALNPVTSAAVSGSITASSSAVSAGWHTFSVTYDGSNLDLYIDGTLATTTAMTSGIASGSSLLHFLLGSYTPNAEKTTWTNFGYDEMRLSDSDRGAEWINAEALAQTDQLVTEQPFESQGGGTTPPPPSETSWTVSSALQRLELSVGDPQLNSSLSNFPVLVEVDQSNFDYADAEPDHLAFVAEGESTPLPYEIERWNPNGTSSFWVKMPTLSTAAGTFDLYYDGAPLNTTVSTEVWEPKFLEVNHFSVDEGVIADSTQNGFDGTPVSGGGLYEQETGSKTFGYLLNGQNGNIDFGSEMGDNLSNYSFSATVDVTPAIIEASSYHQIGGRDQYSGAHPGEQFSMLIHQGHAYASILMESGGALSAVSTPTTGASTAVTAGWHTFTSTYNGSELNLYIDGKLAEKVAVAVTPAHGEALLPFLLGSYTGGEDPTAFNYDEFRLSNVAREPEWIEAEDLAQTNQLVSAAASSEAQSGTVVASVSSPPRGATVAGTVPLTGNVSEPSTVTYKLDGGAEVSLGEVQSAFSSQLTGLADGSHTLVLTADAGAGGSITRTIDFTVDTEAPTIAINTPAAGQVFGVEESFTLDVSTSDPGGVASEAITIDGKEVEDGETVAPSDLPIGEHKLVVEATDSFGNSGTKEITFFTGEGAGFANPQPADGAQGVDPTGATVGVTPSDGIGGKLDVKFRRGYVADDADGGITEVAEGSSTTEPPGDSAGTAVVDPVGIKTASDGKSLVSESSGAFPYQRFTVNVPASIESDSFDAMWSGTVPTGERVALSIWNQTKGSWELVDAATGAGAPLTLEGPAQIAETVSDGNAQMLVQDIPAHVFGDGDATLNTAWLTDTQFYSESNPASLKAETEWVMTHNQEAETKHEPDSAISYGFLTGDIVNSAGSQSQWENASPAFQVWDEAKFPYGLVEGNHDQLNCPYTSQNGCGESNASNPQIPGFSNYQSYFGEDRYDGSSWYGEGQFDNVQHYDLVSTPKANYLYLFLDFYLTPQEITWAKQAITSHPGYNVILATHEYQYQNGSYVTEQPLAGVGIGQRIYNELVKPYSNVLAVFSGHIWPSEHWQTKEPSPGRIVDEVLYDPQSQPNQGNGWMAEVSLNAAAQTMTKKQFSVTIPSLGNSYEVEGHNEESQANFTIPMDIQPPARVLSTDYISATALGGAVLGESKEVASGSEATASVPSSLLNPGEDFAWYGEATDSAGITTQSPLFKFSPTGEFGTTAVTAAGVAAVGQTLTADTSGWQPPADSYAYQWEEDGQAIAGQTAVKLELTPAMEGHQITVTATGTKQNLGDGTAMSPPVTVVKGDFTPGTVTIAGEAKVSGHLSVSLGGWDPTPQAVEYQWLRDGQAIAGATGAGYEPTAADATHALAVQVTVGGEGFNGLTATSAGVTIAGGVLTDVTPPLIEGNVKLGHVVSVNVGETAPAKDAAPHVQWLLEGNPIPNAVQPTYAMQPGDVYKQLSVAVTYAPQGYEPLTVESRELLVAVGDFEPGHPAISGTARVGATVSAEAGEWTPKPAGYTYQWYLDDRPIAGATGSSYQVADADYEHELSVAVTGKASGYNDFTVRSKALVVQAGELAATRKPTIAGKVAEGSTVHAVAGAWSAPVKVTGYQWLLGGKPIAGATGDEYRVAAGTAGKWLSVRVSVESGGYGQAEATSAALSVAKGPQGAAAKPKPAAKKGRGRKKTRRPARGKAKAKEIKHSGSVAILGSGRPGQTVKLDLGRWRPQPSFAYSWMLDGKPVPGATSRRFEIPVKAGGERLAARVVAKKSGYRTTTVKARPLVVRAPAGR
jgi:hypothetical protein